MKREPLNADLVRSFIVAAHGDFEGVKYLLAQEPALIHSVMNWSADDWENGLGAAAHTGNRDIAEWLLAHGARMDIFSAAMLGELEIVQAIIKRTPNAIHAKGAHGIPLINHAKRGGEEAIHVYEYLHARKSEEAVV